MILLAWSYIFNQQHCLAYVVILWVYLSCCSHPPALIFFQICLLWCFLSFGVLEEFWYRSSIWNQGFNSYSSSALWPIMHLWINCCLLWRKVFLAKVEVALTYACKQSYLEGSWIACLLSNLTIIGLSYYLPSHMIFTKFTVPDLNSFLWSKPQI